MNILEHLKDIYFWRLQVAGVDLSISHSTVFMWIAGIFIVITLWLIGRSSKFIPTRSQGTVELVIDFLRGELEPLLGKELKHWLPFLLALFFFILVNNLMGLIPGFTPATSNINVTATLAIIIFLTCQIVGISKRGLIGHFKHLIPADLPWPIIIAFAPIELVSQIARPFSLAVRLFANMYAGQVIILVLAFLIVFFKSLLIAPIPVLGSAVIHIFEIFVSAVQAYIFTYLTTLYISEVVLTEED